MSRSEVKVDKPTHVARGKHQHHVLNTNQLAGEILRLTIWPKVCGHPCPRSFSFSFGLELFFMVWATAFYSNQIYCGK